MSEKASRRQKKKKAVFFLNFYLLYILIKLGVKKFEFLENGVWGELGFQLNIDFVLVKKV